MVVSLLITAATLSCPKVWVINTTEFPWNDHDRKTLAYVETRCVQVYPDAPCVKLFKKWGKQDYSVICGAEVNDRKT